MIARMEGQSKKERPAPRMTKRRELSNEDARIWSEGRPWPVRALTFLLALQAGAVLALALSRLYQGPPLAVLLAEPESAFFVPLPALAFLGLVATLGFLWLRPGAWVVAMLVQGLHLIVALAFYFLYGQKQIYQFALMLFAVVMVIYLNYAEVPAVFRAFPDELDDDA
jgi:hypothetical protein